MYDTVRRVGVRSFLFRESIPLVGALAVTEIFCKLHSFTLEALVFLCLWYVFAFAGSRFPLRTEED